MISPRGHVWDGHTPLPPVHEHPVMPTNKRQITFDTHGSTLDECDEAARAVAERAFNTVGFHLSNGRYVAVEQTGSNNVIVWRGSYTASVQVPVT